MPRTYSKIVLHWVYSTKNRVPRIREPERAWRITREIARNLKVDILAIGGTADHIHLLLALPPNRALSDVIRNLKANSSLILRQKDRSFRWQDGYGVISVSPSAVPAATRYIEHQVEHHAAKKFEAEYIEMLERAGIKNEPEYVLD
jgi:REP element-mobilizing transposase RayT